ncbi:MAG: serine/threonine-protein kinase [Nannocystaceae bacterium]
MAAGESDADARSEHALFGETIAGADTRDTRDASSFALERTVTPGIDEPLELERTFAADGPRATGGPLRDVTTTEGGLDFGSTMAVDAAPPRRPTLAVADRTPPAANGASAPISGYDRTPPAVTRSSSLHRLATPAAPPTLRLGRYVVLEPLGEGGMGIVYAAYDPELDRKVAIKLIRSAHAGDEARLRLLREAQAMAKLSHPNVVAVYDVGTFEGQVFVAMELIRGETLGDWFKEHERSWREIVEKFIAAGRGLAAAHDAGLIHRDFKPDNVLLDDDRAVKVTDFGLARVDTQGATLDDERRRRIAVGDGGTLDLALTRAGAIMGTPAYMAPEQHRGAGTDARSDQFAFCVALYQALYAQLPFPATTLFELVDAVMAGRIAEPPPARRAKVPAWLHRAVLRGLATDPERRWPSVHALIAELARDRQRLRRWGGLAGLAAVIGVGAALVVGGDEPDLCSGGRTELAGIWDEASAREVDTALRATGLSYADATADKVAATLDAQTDAWVEAFTAACQARHRGELSDELYGLELACLYRRRDELAARVDVLREADAEVVERALMTLGDVASLDTCRDPSHLRARIPPPDDPRVATQVQELRQRLDRARAEGAAGRPRRALPIAAAAVDSAEGLDYPPVLAEALLVKGDQLDRLADYDAAEQTLREAWWQALASGHDEVSAGAAIRLLKEIGSRRADATRGLVWGRNAAALLDRRGADGADERGLYLSNLAGVLVGKGDYDDALATVDRALAHERDRLGNDHPSVARLLAQRGDILRRLGRYDDATAALEEALAIFRATLSDDHPRVAVTLNNLGATFVEHRDLERARRAHEEALAIRERALGDDHPEVASSASNLGVVLMEQGEYDAAEAAFKRAIAIREAGGVDPALSDPIVNLGNLHLLRGQSDAALAAYRRALANDLAVFGEEHPNVAFSRNNVGTALWLSGELEAAAAELEAAHALLAKRLGNDHPILAAPLLGLAEVALDRGDAAAARPLLAAAEARARSSWSAAELARIRFADARARWLLGQDREGARADAEAAIADLAAGGLPLRESTRRARAWLSGLPTKQRRADNLPLQTAPRAPAPTPRRRSRHAKWSFIPSCEATKPSAR